MIFYSFLLTGFESGICDVACTLGGCCLADTLEGVIFFWSLGLLLKDFISSLQFARLEAGSLLI